MNKKRSFLVLVLLLVIIVTIYTSTFIQPKIVFTAEINKVSNEDYKRIINNNQVKSPNKNIDQFKHIDIQIKVVEPMGLNNHVKIERDSLHQYAENIDKIQLLGGGSFEYGDKNEYGESIEIYIGNLSENNLRNMLENFRYKVTWKDLWNNKNDKIFYLRDYLK